MTEKRIIKHTISMTGGVSYVTANAQQVGAYKTIDFMANHLGHLFLDNKQLRDQLATATDRLAEVERERGNLVTLVRRTARRIRVANRDDPVAGSALEYLVRKGLMPSPLREDLA